MSDNPYYSQLWKYQGKKVTLHRANAADLTGQIQDISHEGCYVTNPGNEPESIRRVFVALKDIRGIEHDYWDLDTAS